jgi:tRNA A-37 threonylcarbamoyl transferase component Bud32
MSVNPERWRRLKDLFEAALELDPSARAGFLDRACSEDPGMRDEAEALLRHHESGDGFLERPAYEESAYLLTSAPSGGQPEEMPLGPYTLVRKLGEGGMGIVYLARDTRLGRPVAIKALPPRFTRDERLRARLRSEAVAVARLSHPGIATIYSLEEIDGNLYLVLEYVRGRTLREELEGKPLPPPRILDTAVQVARALSAAHAQGIVHRDLKPENVMLSEGGGVKILDFGLARFLDAPLPEGVRETRLTQSGTFVGTPAYASPEQLVGGEVDFRTDIFSFGVLLFELASGAHPFAAPDPVSSIARVFDADDLDLSPVEAAASSELARIIRRCLRKQPPARYAATIDLVTDLERLQTAGAGIGSPEAKWEADGARTEPSSREFRPKPLWWWQFHQAVVGLIYCLMLYPLWRTRGWTESPWGELIFFPALAAVAVAANLRFHLWFTSAFYPLELREQRRRAAAWIRGADIAFAGLLLLGASAIHRSQGAVATLLVGVAIGSLVQSTLIEPTTARAAFRSRDDGRDEPG